MKYKYLKINGIAIWGQNYITKDDLVKVKERYYDTIINTETNQYYDADENKWLDIEGE